MITDKMADAAYDAFHKAEELNRTLNWCIHAALEAAEAAAWCDDIGQAPKDEFILVHVDGFKQPRKVAYSSKNRYWFGPEDFIGRDFAVERVKRWRHLPQPPNEETK